MNTLLEDPEYPELLADMARVAEQVLRDDGIPEDQAKRTAFALAEHMRGYWGGQIVSVAKGHRLKTRQRWRAVWEKFTGDNHAELAREFDLSLQQVYKIIEIMKRDHVARSQHALFVND